ncbi:hypothetical protein AQUCO_09300016v1 [Aquilegia coerulea]|uniref:Serine aminopeptidase S33 domain-containing protein n=1 Tax=Aquilegia coerulea TaxID=218851 RepID=A0A2G5C6I8_AQUCA|nr:hypothetical protein AQUCO_09300016v1 [Aquilegia coerulea]
MATEQNPNTAVTVVAVNQQNEQQKKIVILNKHGEKLVGILLHQNQTQGEEENNEFVILCHGLLSNKESNVMVNIAVALQKKGITSFRFDFAGNGYINNMVYRLSFRESEGTLQDIYWREVDDLHSVIQHFSTQNCLPTAIIGHSKGGDVVLLYPSKYHDIRTIVNISGRYDLKKGIEERLGKDFMEKIKEEGFIDVKNKQGIITYRVTKENLEERLTTDIHGSCLQIEKECRVLIVHGSADTIVPIQDAHDFTKIIPNCKLEIIKKANHGYTSHQAKLASVVVDFIHRHSLH